MWYSFSDEKNKKSQEGKTVNNDTRLSLSCFPALGIALVHVDFCVYTCWSFGLTKKICQFYPDEKYIWTGIFFLIHLIYLLPLSIRSLTNLGVKKADFWWPCIGGSRGAAAGARPPPQASRFFRFYTLIFRDGATSEVFSKLILADSFWILDTEFSNYSFVHPKFSIKLFLKSTLVLTLG